MSEENEAEGKPFPTAIGFSTLFSTTSVKAVPLIEMKVLSREMAIDGLALQIIQIINR